MDWRLALAAVVVLATLAGGALLVAQVEQDLSSHLDVPIERTAFEREEDVPLKLKDFKLPSDLPIQIPPGTKISPDLGEMTLPRDLDVQLPEGLDLSGLKLDLPEDFDLTLPPGTTFDASSLELPEGGSIRLPDGQELSIPPGTKLDLPPDLARRLLEGGVPIGSLPNGMNVPIRDLPPGLDLGVDPGKLVGGGGTLRLPSGTVIRLPPGASLPAGGIAPGVLATALSYLLPAGTELDIPALGSGGFPGRVSTMPLPDPHVPPGSSNGSDGASAEPPGTVPVVTEIDRLPDRVRKGQPFRIEGYVRERATGFGVSGAPVEVFVNETKTQPGTFVGRARTDAAGRFSLSVELPRDKPAGNYQLVNHASPFRGPDGRLYGEAWGDPPFSAYSATKLNLTVPARATLRTPVVLQGTLLDETGAPVPGVGVDMYVDGVMLGRVTTGSNGGFGVTHVFTTLGLHQVQAEFGGNAHYEAAARVRATLTVDDLPSVEVPASVSVTRGAVHTFTGRALVGVRPLAGESVEVRTPYDGAVTVTAAADGTFSYATRIPDDQPLGAMEMRYRLPDRGVSQTQRAEVQVVGVIEMAVPSRVSMRDDGILVDLRFVDPQGRGVAGVPLLARLSGPGGTRELSDVTDASGGLTFLLDPPIDAPGAYTVTALSTHPSVKANAASARVLLGDVEVRWSLPPTLVRGRAVNVDATVLLGGTPLANEPVTLDLFGKRGGTSGADGRVSWTLTVPTAAAPGPHKGIVTAAVDGAQFPQETRVVAIPRLVVEAPDEHQAPDAIPVNVTLVDDVGAPMPSQPVGLRLRVGGNESAVVRGTTDGAGRWTGSVPVQKDVAGNVTLLARHDASTTTLSAEDARVVEVKSAEIVQPVPERPEWLIPAALGAVALAGAGAGAYLLRERLFRSRAAAAATISLAPAAPAPPAAAQAADLDLRLGIPEGEPLVWGIGEPLEATVRSRGAPRPGSLVSIEARGARSTLHLDAEGAAHATLVPEQEGDLVVVARRPDEASQPALVRVEVVDYRKAVAREFDALVERSRAAGLPITRQSTPREVETVLGARLGEGAAPLLDEVALLMEVTNYSKAPVSRRDFLRFHAANERLRALLAGG